MSRAEADTGAGDADGAPFEGLEWRPKIDRLESESGVEPRCEDASAASPDCKSVTPGSYSS